ncbi:MAG TPA: cytochrome c-type biogenesis protein [Acidimicrobiales bacterium]|nr:cytochrome c-type biogenesis protein [Acidimicrobiales bacterium]
MTAIAIANQRKRNHLAWIVMIPVLLVALFIGVTGSRGPRTNTDRVNAIAAEFKCPTCRSESVETSNAQTARIIRADIARRVEQGQTDDEIRAYLISRYGQELLLTPASTGASSLVWILPVVALVAAIAGLAVAFRRWHAKSEGEISDSDRRLVEAAMRVERAHTDGDAGGS